MREAIDVLIYNTALEKIGVLDYYNSFIWNKKYADAGEFEIHIEATEETIAMLREDYYVMREDDDSVGIIEDIKIAYDAGSEIDMLTVSGRFAESIIGRRIVWKQTQVYGTVENGLRSLVTQNVISPTDENRKISIQKLGNVKGFAERLEAQYTGDNVLSVMTEVCTANGMGFRNIFKKGNFYLEFYKGVDRSYDQMEGSEVITFKQKYYQKGSIDIEGTKKYETAKIETEYARKKNVRLKHTLDILPSTTYKFKVPDGITMVLIWCNEEDRVLAKSTHAAGEHQVTSTANYKKIGAVFSWDNGADIYLTHMENINITIEKVPLPTHLNPYVVFSDEYDNLASSVYQLKKSKSYSTAIVRGEGEGTARKTSTIYNEIAGLDRRELNVDARDLQSNDGKIEENKYKASLVQRGNEKLSESMIVETFEGEVEITDRYEWKKDIYLGDVVTVENTKYNMRYSTRIIGSIECYDSKGYSLILELGN
jgi:hypothetical protein